MKGKPKLHPLHEHQPNTHSTADSVVKQSQKKNQIAHIPVRDMCSIDPHKLAITQPSPNTPSRNPQNGFRTEKNPYCRKRISDSGPQKNLAANFQSLRAQTLEFGRQTLPKTQIKNPPPTIRAPLYSKAILKVS